MKLHLNVILKNILLMVISLCLSIIIAEIAIRLFIPQKIYRFPKGMFKKDSILGFRPTPKFEGVMRNPEYKTHIQINSKGLRDREYGPKEPGVFRILSLGDSFTMGYNVKFNETYPKVLEEILKNKNHEHKYEVINAGVDAYGTEQELNYFKTEGLNYSPDLVMLGFYVGNDVQNNMEPRKLTVEDGYLISRKRSSGILPLNVRHFLARHSHLYLFLWDKYNSLLCGIGQRSKKIPHFIEIFSKEYCPELQKGWERTLNLLEEIIQISRLLNAEVVIIVIPTKFQVHEYLWTKSLIEINLDKEDYDLEKPNKILLNFGKENQVPVIDLLPALRAQGQEKTLYHLLDGHWNQTGNTLVGKEIYNFLVANNFLS